MKISIITLHRIFNYGSVFQSYATQKVLQDMGHDCEFVDYIPERISKRRIFFGYSIMLYNRWYDRIKCMIVYFPLRLYNMVIFDRFVRKYLKVTKKKYHSLAELKQDTPSADIYMTGSDQVWNSHYNEFVDPVYFLDYAPIGKRRVAYAASFGKTQLDANERELTKPYVMRYDAISTREAQALEILRDMGYENGVAVLDPTLLLKRDDWQRFVSKRVPQNKFVLIYSILSHDHLVDYARQIADRLGAKVYLIGMGYWADKRVDRTLRFQTPEQFITLFEQAEYVVTDSFHGTAFSINMNKQFIASSPPQFNIRLLNILRKTGLEDRMFDDSKEFDVVKALREIDYAMVNQKLDTERDKSLNFLRNSLKQ